MAPNPSATLRRSPALGHRSTVLDGVAPLPRDLQRVSGGTFSATVSRLHLVGGAQVLADVVRLTPNVDAYSVQLDGVSPRHGATYRGVEWGLGVAELAAHGAPVGRLARSEAAVA